MGCSAAKEYLSQTELYPYPQSLKMMYGYGLHLKGRKNPTGLPVGISQESKLPKEYREETTEHKIALIKFHYNNIVAQYSNIEISDEDFKNVAIADNRVFKGEGNIINQYTLDESFKNNEKIGRSKMVGTYGHIDEVLFLTNTHRQACGVAAM